MKSKKILMLFVVFVVLVLPVHSLKTQVNQTVKIDDFREDNYLIAGGNVNLSNSLNGDLIALSGNLNSRADVSGNSYVVSGRPVISGDLAGDLVLVSGDATIDSNVYGNVIALTGNIYVSDNSSIKGDLIVLGGAAVLNGSVDGDVYARGGMLLINDKVQGDVDVSAGDFRLGHDAFINGNITYKSDAGKKINKSQVGGSVTYLKKVVDAQTVYEKVGSKLVWALMYLIQGILIFYLLPGSFKNLTGNVENRTAMSLLVGVIALFLLPLMSIVLLVTVIGLPLAIFGGFVMVAAFFLSKSIVGYSIGKFIFERFIKRPQTEVFYKLLVGVVVLEGLFWVPGIGGLLGFLVFLVGLGSLLLGLKNVFKFKKNRKKKIQVNNPNKGRYYQ